MNKFSYDLFSELYHLRWPVEEDYKTIKYRLEVENFSGKSVLPVYRDFHAKLFSKNLAAVVASTTKNRFSKNLRSSNMLIRSISPRPYQK